MAHLRLRVAHPRRAIQAVSVPVVDKAARPKVATIGAVARRPVCLPTLFVSPEGSETAAEAMLAPVAASYSTTCPTFTPSNCSDAVGTCVENGHRYGQLGLLALEQGSAVAVYTHELIDRDNELLGCSGRVLATERGSVELAITRTPVAAGDAEPEVLLSRRFDSMGFNLREDQDLKVAATGNVIHVFDGIDYFVVDAGAL